MATSNVISQPAPAPRGVSRILGQKIIKTRFQIKFSMVIFAFLSAAMFVIWFEGRVAVRSLVETRAVVSEEAILQLELLNTVVRNTSVVALAIVFGLSLFFSHFVAGPIYRFEKTLEEIRDGNLSMVVRLRKHDEFREMADLFNAALGSLRRKLGDERAAVAQLLVKAEEVVSRLRSQGNVTEADEIASAIEALRRRETTLHI